MSTRIRNVSNRIVLIVMLAVIWLWGASTPANVLLVPTSYPTITAAVAIAAERDTILLLDGVYSEQVLVEHPITIASMFLLDGDSSHILTTEVTIPDSIRNDATRSRSPFEIRNVNGFVLVGITVFDGLGTPYVYTTIPIMSGGGVFALASNVTIRRCRIRDAIAVRGGGILAYQSKLRLEESRIERCNFNCSGTGGGVYFSGDSVIVRKSYFSENQLSYGDGGGLYAIANQYGEFCDNIVVDNIAPARGGGCFFNGFSLLANNRIERNYSSMFGGLSINNSSSHNTFVFRDNIIRGNQAIYYPERLVTGIGGVFIDSPTGVTCEITGNRFEGNSATNQEALAFGGALVLQGGTANLRRNFFNGNEGSGGSAIGTTGVETIINVDSNSFCDNIGDIAVRNLSYGSLRLSACDFIHNQGVAVSASTSTIDAIGCYWGHPSGPRTSTNPDGMGDSIGVTVVYEPFLFEPVFPENGSTSPEKPNHDSPQLFSLIEAYPNPFNGAVTISYLVSKPNESIRITIFDPMGRKVANLFDGTPLSGVNRIYWKPEQTASGSYFVRVESKSGLAATTQMLLIK